MNQNECSVSFVFFLINAFADVENAKMLRKLEYNATITQRIEIAPGLIIIRVKPDHELFDFKAGQYTVLGLKRKESRCPEADPDPEELKQREPDEMIRRAYSISSASVEKEFIEFYVALVKSGDLTPRIFNLNIGDRIFLGPKATGFFTLDQVPEGKHVCLLATGTGLAPYISMVRSELVAHPNRLFLILHGARYSWDLGYRDELNSLRRVCPNLKYYPTISRPDIDTSWNGFTGRVQDYVTNGVVEGDIGMKITPEDFHIFLCGNPNMIEETIELMEKRGFHKGTRRQPGNLHTEEYW